MKKLKTSLIALTKISLICLAFFVFTPSLKAHAMFSDTASINMGIQLKLGTVSLAKEDFTSNEVVRYTEGKPVLVASGNLINEGSLSGKLAYKIDVTKEDGTMLKDEEKKDMSVIINFGDVANKVTASAASLNTSSFIFAKDSSSNDIIIEPDPVNKALVTVNYESSVPAKDEKLLKITVTFRLIQSNAADANAEMFSDEETLANTVTLFPKVIEEKSYWPDASTFVDVEGKFSYSLEKMNMVFSEVYNEENSNEKVIKNLNKAVLYIQFPEKEPVITTVEVNGIKEKITTFDFYNLTVENSAIKVYKEEIDEMNNGVRITFDLIDKYNSSDPNALSQFENKALYYLNLQSNINKYNISEKKYDIYYSHIGFQVPFFATRLVLSSDLVVPINNSNTNYSQLPIKLTEEEVNISFKKFNSWTVGSADPIYFTDVQLNNEIIELKITGKKPESVIYPLTPKNKFFLKLDPKSNGNIKGTFLNVKITGDAGNTLVIHRELENKSGFTTTTSFSSFLAEEPTEQAINPEKSVEVPDSSIDKMALDEQAVKSSVEESDTEQVIDEAEVVKETKEAVDSSSIDSAAESIEESNQSASVESINNE